METTISKPVSVITSQDANYMLTDDGMFKLRETFVPADPKVRSLSLGSPNLSRNVVRKIFKTGKGRVKQGWRYVISANTAKIGCQFFTGPSFEALKQWAGVRA